MPYKDKQERNKAQRDYYLKNKEKEFERMKKYRERIALRRLVQKHNFVTVPVKKESVVTVPTPYQPKNVVTDPLKVVTVPVTDPKQFIGKKAVIEDLRVKIKEMERKEVKQEVKELSDYRVDTSEEIPIWES